MFEVQIKLKLKYLSYFWLNHVDLKTLFAVFSLCCDRREYRSSQFNPAGDMDLKLLLAIILICIVSIHLAGGKKTKNRVKRRRLRGFRDAKPNIILILADDLDIALGSPNVMKRTQRLLKEGGTEFVNTFVTSSICCPSRSSILTGKYSHNHKINSNAGECAAPSWQDGPERFSYGKLLQDAGYTTGKSIRRFPFL